MRTLADFLAFESHGRKTAFVEQTAYRTRKYSYVDVWDGIRRAAHYMEANSIAAGDRVILWGGNSARWAMTFYACLLQRIVVVPVDASFSKEFVRKVADLTEAKLVLCDTEAALWDELFQASSHASIQQNESADGTLLEIIYTSGTTGEPKGVMITHGNVLSNLIPIWDEYRK